MRKGIIILGPQGSGKTRLAEAIAERYPKGTVAEFEVTEKTACVAERKIKTVILDAVTDFRIVDYFLTKWVCHKVIVVSQQKEEDVPSHLRQFFNVITLK